MEYKEIVWIGSSLKDLKELPDKVKKDIGFVLWNVQQNEPDSHIKPLKEFNGVSEIRIDFDKDTYRAVYTFKLGTKIYVLHVFKKKSTKGIATPKKDIDVIQKRLKTAKELAKDE